MGFIARLPFKVEGDSTFGPGIYDMKGGVYLDGKGAQTHYEQMYISSIEPRARLLHRLYQTLR